MKKIHYTFFTLFILLGTTCWIQFSKFESEIKSKINSSEIKTTIQKFNNCRNLEGFKGRSCLFGFDSDLKNKSVSS